MKWIERAGERLNKKVLDALQNMSKQGNFDTESYVYGSYVMYSCACLLLLNIMEDSIL